MSTKLNVELFTSILKKSGLVADGPLERAIRDYAAKEDAKNENPSDDPRPFAAYLISLDLLTKWQVEKLLQGKHRGFFLGKYKLLSLLGKGGMSSVYLAEHLTMRRRCAMKVLPAKRVADSSYLERFHREAQAVALLDHPNIVRAYDMDHQADGSQQIHFLVMELVEGDSIFDLVGEDGMESFLDAAEYARQAASGLQHAHDHGMVHRDIKPGNLLVDRAGVLKILDLGLARFFTADEGNDALTIRHDERVLGTADYLAPEQAIDSHAVDSRADIYSLGCTFYFMLTGKPPFTEGTLAQRLLAHQIKMPPAVESLRSDVPPALAEIVRKMMEKRPENRYPTAESVEAALFQWIDQTADSTWRRAHSRNYEPRKNDSIGVKIAMPVLPPKNEPQIESPVSWDEPSASSVFPSSEGVSDHSVNSQETLIHPMTFAKTRSEADQVINRPHLDPTSLPVRESPFAPDQPATLTTTDDAPRKRTSDSSLSFLVFESDDSTKSSGTSLRKLRPSPARLVLSQFTGWLTANWKSPAVLGGIAAIAVLVAAMGLYSLRIFGNSSSPDTAAGAFTSGKQEVTVGPHHGDFTRIRDALIAVRDRYHPRAGNRDNFTIRIQSGVYRERIRIDGRGKPWPEGIVVRGETGTIIEAIDDQPVIRLANVSRFTIENVQIDARQNPTAVELADELYECRVQQIAIRGFKDVGVDCQGAQGLSLSNDQLLLEQIEFEPAGSRAFGIRLSDGIEKDVCNLVIRQCRFLRPMQAGILIDGKSVHGVEISQSLFNQVTDGVRVSQRPLLRSLRVLNNSFRDVSIGVRFSHLPNELSSDLAFRRNLFTNVSLAESLVQESIDPALFRPMFSVNPLGIENNWSDRDSPTTAEGEIPFLFENGGRRGVTGFEFVSTDPQDSKFLAPSETSPQKEVSGSYPNDMKWVGAIGGR